MKDYRAFRCDPVATITGAPARANAEEFSRFEMVLANLFQELGL